ncbi:MAG: hypothetical protein NVSMB46_00340 [Candidatus Saccharimonadales bacterium]
MPQENLFSKNPLIPDNNEITHDVLLHGYSELPFQLGKSACTELFKEFDVFMGLCLERNGSTLSRSVAYETNSAGTGTYYVAFRRPGEINPAEPDRVPGTDHKYTFHFGSQTVQRAKNELGALPKEMLHFLDHTEEFYYAMTRTARLGATALGLERILFSDDASERNHHLRFLHYVGDNSDNLGAAHFDRSVASLAITESRSGLRGAPGQNGKISPITSDYMKELMQKLRPIEHEENVAKFFLSAGYNHILDNENINALPLLCHDILNDQPHEARFALVGFLNPTQEYRNYQAPLSHETGCREIIQHLDTIAV